MTHKVEVMFCTTRVLHAGEGNTRLEAESDIARRIKAKHDGQVDEVGVKENKEVVLDTELDFTNRTFRIRGAKLAGKIEATLRNLGRLMELHLNSRPAELEPYAEAFASANGIAEDVSATTTLRDVCSLAYALHIAASHMPGWKAYVGSQQLPIAEDADITELLDELFGPSSSSASGSAAKSSRKKGKPGKRPKSRSKSKEPRKVGEKGKEAGKNGAGRSKTRRGEGASGDNVAKPPRARSPQPAEVAGKDDPAQRGGSPKSRKVVAKKPKQEMNASSARTKGSKRKAK